MTKPDYKTIDGHHIGQDDYRIKDLARKVGESESYIRNAISNHGLTAFKISGGVYVNLKDWENWCKTVVVHRRGEKKTKVIVKSATIRMIESLPKDMYSEIEEHFKVAILTKLNEALKHPNSGV